MSVEIRMPELTSDMTEGDLVQWLVAEGDRVEVGDLIAEIDTDKSTVEFESPVSGVISELCIPAPRTSVKVGELLARIEPSDPAEAGESASQPQAARATEARSTAVRADARPKAAADPAPAPSASEPTPAPDDTDAPAGLRTRPGAAATALARRIAEQRGVQLGSVAGSGAGGRVTRLDVERAADGPGTPAQSTAPPESSLSRMQWGAPSPAHQSAGGALISVSFTVLEAVCNAELLEATHRKLRETPAARALSIGDFAVAAAARALRDCPAANRSWQGDQLVSNEHADLAVRIGGEAGGVALIVRDADRFGLAELSQRLRDLSERARAGSLSPEELQGGSLGIATLESHAITRVAPSVAPPLTAVFGVGSLERVPVLRDDQVVPGTRVVCTLVADPRAIDSALGARLLASFRRYFEDPLAMLL